MVQQREQKITVKSDTLGNLVVSVERGEYRIPQFQREFVWKPSKIIELFDSIYREFPIGSFFLWKAGREHNKLFRHIIDLGIPPVGEHDNVTFILDGQQRITSLYATLKGMVLNGFDYSGIVFDLKDQRFVNHAADNRRYVSVCDIWGAGAMNLSRQIEGAYIPQFDRCFETLRTYPVSLVEVKDKDLPAVCKIFQRINQSGKRLDRFDLIVATTFSTDFDLREKFKSDLLTPLKAKHFGEIAPTVVTQLMALMKSGQCTERYEFSLTTADIKGMWSRVVDAIFLAADALRRSMGVVNSGYLPYEAHLTLLAYYFMKSGNRSIPPDHLTWISRWFWRSSFAQRYTAGGPTRMGQDRELFDKLIDGHVRPFDIPLSIGVTDLVRVSMRQTTAAIRNAFLSLLAVREPMHLVNNSKLDLVNGGITDFTDPEKHHVFPQAFLKRSGPQGVDIHSLPNFCFLTAELNKRINDTDPSKYYVELQRQNPHFAQATLSHLLPADPTAAGILQDDYLRFLRYRGELLLAEIKRLCGEITTPRVNERQISIEQLEYQIREIIHHTLSKRFAANYWKSNIPQSIRDEVDKRIREALRKNPALKENDFQDVRRKLDYLNVMEYLTIIENGANWPSFQVAFRNKEELQRYLSIFNDYRNVLMHGRPMTELIEANGNAALLWLTSILATEDENKEEIVEEQESE